MNVARIATIAAISTVSCIGVVFAIKKYNDHKKITPVEVQQLKEEIAAARPVVTETLSDNVVVLEVPSKGKGITETSVDSSDANTGLSMEKSGRDWTEESNPRLAAAVTEIKDVPEKIVDREQIKVEMRRPPRARPRVQVDNFAAMASFMRQNNIDLESGKPQAPATNVEQFEHYEEMELFLDFFEKLQARGKEMEFDRKWLNGTDYMDNVVHVKMAGGYYATQDHVSNRKAIIHSTKRGNTVIFQRYSNGSDGILVWNGPEDAKLGDNMLDVDHVQRFISGTYLQSRKQS